MRGSALWFAEQIQKDGNRQFDLILTSDMTDVANLRGLLATGLCQIPILTYFHENQLTYPIPDEDERDYQYGFTNIISALVSNAVWFNSTYHQNAFLAAADKLIRKMPDYQPALAIAAIQSKSSVVYPLVENPPKSRRIASHSSNDSSAKRGPRILWSHRWEYDKNPEAFFAAMVQLAEERVPFELVILGESFRQAPSVFAQAHEILIPHILHSGFVKSRNDYWQLVGGCDLVVSTAIQENFGISVVEAILAGCRPLLPNRLSYPELISSEFHQQCLYDDDQLLPTMIKSWSPAPSLSHDLSATAATRFTPTPDRVTTIDEGLTQIA